MLVLPWCAGYASLIIESHSRRGVYLLLLGWYCRVTVPSLGMAALFSAGMGLLLLAKLPLISWMLRHGEGGVVAILGASASERCDAALAQLRTTTAVQSIME